MISPTFRVVLVATALVLLANSFGKDSIGLLKPRDELAIGCSKTNLGVNADYNFAFIPTTTIPAGGKVQVTFPRQYASGLGLPASPTCMPTACAVSGYVVTFTLSSSCVRGSVCSVQVSSVLNPSTAGGTGPFQLVSTLNSYVLDMNSYFGVIGIEGAPGILTSTSVSVASGQSSYAGEDTQYDFLFTLSKWTPAYSWMRFTFPSDDYIISNYPTCSSITINGYKLPGSFACTLTSTKVTLTGFSDTIQPGTSLGIRIAVTNPRKAITTGSFSIETGRNSTNTVYEQKTGIPGVTINPGRISGISLLPVDPSLTQSTNNVMRYTLKFSFYNPIEQGGSILVVCNNNFNLGTNNLFWVNSGLTDISVTQQVTSSYSSGSNILTITNFKTYSGGEISLMLELKNPSTSGNTLPLGIKSLKSDGTTLIDQDLVTAITTISTISSPSISVAPAAGDADVNKRASDSLTLHFTLIPNLQIPELGSITILFPSSFSLSSPICSMKPKNIAIESTTCTAANGKLTVILKATIATAPSGSGSFLVGVDSYIKVQGITAGPVPGKYSMELQTLDQNGIMLETGNALFTTVASEFLATTMSSVHDRAGEKTILAFAFTPTQVIPAGVTPAAITDQQGFIEILLPTAAGYFATDLGLGISGGGTVPCRHITGITPAVSGGSLTCILSGVVTGTSTVTVSDFASIAANTAVVLHIAGVQHTSSGNSPSITITSYQKANRLRTDLNTKTASITAPAAVIVTSASAGSFTSTVKTVSTATTLGGPIDIPVTASLNCLLRFSSHDNGYCAATTSFTCKIGATIYSVCYCYAGADMIYIQTNTSPAGASTTTFEFAGIVNPASVPVAADSITVYIISGNTLLSAKSYASQLPLQVAGIFTTATVQADKKGLSYVNVKMDFTLIPSHSIPDGGSIVINLPSMFSLTNSSPLPTCITSQLTAKTTAGVTCGFIGSTVTLTNFKPVIAGTSAIVTITGIKNPSSGASTGFFSYSTYNAGALLIDSNTQVPGYSFTSNYVTGTISISAIDAYPNNGRAIAEYAISFSVSTPVPVGGEIRISFPIANFGILPSPADCRINGAATYFQSCTTSGSMATIVTSTEIPAAKVVVSIFNVANFNQGTSSAFSMYTVYDGLTLDQTAAVSSGSMIILTTATAQPLKVNSITADPLNEGEMSTYKFNITPTNNVASYQTFIITFPPTFDPHIADGVTCTATGLSGYITCTVTAAWQLSLSSTDSFNACGTCNIELWVYGAINPQRISGATSGQFKIGIFSANTYVEYNENAGTVTYLAAPGYNNLWTFSTSNKNARDVNDFVLNMTMTQTIPQTKYQGAVWVQFPSDYSLLAAIVNCESSSYWAGGVPDCSIYNNRIILKGQVTDFVGNLMIYLFNVPNPLTEMTANSITAKTYDGLNYKVLDSSYANTNPTQVTYKYPGPLIVINKDLPIYVERGTVSADIPVELAYPAALNLTLVPQADEFTFMPYTISITIGDMFHSFRIAVHENIPATAYVMTWTTEGDNIPPFYTPIQASLVIVTKSQNTLVRTPALAIIPQGGKSLPSWINLQNAPDVDLTVAVKVDGLEGISVSPSSLTFSAGVQNATYIISTTANVTAFGTGVVSYSLSGTNVNVYRLEQPSQTFTVGPDDGKLPAITGVSLVGLARTSVTIVPITSKPGIAYYMFALDGTATPTYENVKAGGPVLYPSTQSIYGNVTLDGSLMSQFYLSGLVAQTQYAVYLYIDDMMGRRSMDCFKYNFTTLNRYATARTQLRFTQSYLDEMEVETIVDSVGLILSLDYRRVLTWDKTKQQRRLAIKKTSYLELYVIDDPKSDNYPMPKDLLIRLSSKIAALASLLPTLDLTWSIPIETWNSPACGFQTTPMMSGYNSFNSISFLSALIFDGVIYAFVENVTDSTGIPRSQQIFIGLNKENRAGQTLQRSVTGGVLTNSTFTDLAPSTTYQIYVTCGSLDPGFPELLADGSVVSMSWTTAAAPKRNSLNLDWAAFGLSIWGVAVLAFL